MFEWDENKRRSNLIKHGVDFIDAAKIFFTPTLEKPDPRQGYGEERFVAIGVAPLGAFVVIYTWRYQREQKIRRIISAWKAGDDEQKIYHAFIQS